MKRLLPYTLPILWTLAFLLPTVYVVAWALESIYEVPLAEESFRFEREWAWLLLPAALLVLAARGYLTPHQAPRLTVSRVALLKKQRRGLRLWLKDSLIGLRVTTVALVAFALMGPQSIHARDRAEVEGIDIVLTIDMSLSMQGSDIAPNRFEASKQVVDSFIRRRPNDRMGAVVFGKNAYTLLPLTTDKEALRATIAELELEQIDGRGTAIGDAVATSLNRLRDSEAESRVIILLTDGNSNSGDVPPEQSAEFAETMGVKVFTILMGATDETRVQRGLGLGGRPIFDVGNHPVNPELLQSLAERTGGTYFAVSDRVGLERSFHEILNELEKSEIEDTGKSYGELFPAFVWPALAFLCLELLLGAFLFRRWP